MGSGVWEDAPYTLWNGLSLIGMGIDSTTIRLGNHSGWIHMIVTQSNVFIKNFTFDGTNMNYANDAILPVLHATNISIVDNRFTRLWIGINEGSNTGQIVNNIFINCQTAIDASFDACSLLVKNNTITGCTERGIDAYGGNWTITNNLFYNNPGSLMLGLFFYRVSDTSYVANNLFYNNQWNPNLQSHVIALYGEGVVNNTFIGPDNLGDQRASFINALIVNDVLWSRNNVFAHFYTAFELYSYPFYTQLDISYTDIWRVSYNDIGYGGAHYLEGNLFADPMFADSTNFYLQAFSPLIDAGDPSILDVDGTRSDIGCYGGPGGCSYVYLDLAPMIPDSLSARVDSNIIIMNWHYNTEADFNCYQIFRDSVSGFTPLDFNMIAEPETSYFEDNNITPGISYFYRLTAVDNQHNISDYSDEIAVVPTSTPGDGENHMPRYSVISGAYPNPFNSNVTIVYSASNVGDQL